jgi:hypothetical protein
VKSVGQLEIDELYVAIDGYGAHYVVPVQAKGGNDQLGIVQVEQDIAYCQEAYPNLICCPVAAQFLEDDVIALFLLEVQDDMVRVSREAHYRLVPAPSLSDDDLRHYAQQARLSKK